MLKAEYIVYLWLDIKVSCICKNHNANCLKFGQQLLGLKEDKSLIMKVDLDLS